MQSRLEKRRLFVRRLEVDEIHASAREQRKNFQLVVRERPAVTRRPVTARTRCNRTGL